MSQPAADPLGAAFEHHRAGNIALAEQLYRQILSQDPQRAEAWNLLGVVCLQSGRNAEAAQLIERAIAIRGDNPEFYNHLGAAYSGLGRHDQAVATVRRAVQLAPQSASAHYNLGTALRNQGRLEEAIVSYRHALAADPNSAEAHYNLANTLRDVKRLGEAEASYREALRARPGYFKAMINLGNVLHFQGKLTDAIDMIGAAIAINPNHANGHLNLGIALRDSGRHQPAVESLRRAVALDPQLPEAHANLGTVLQAQARFAEALACYEEALRLNPQLPDAHFSRATHRLRQGELEGGFAEYEWRWKCTCFSMRQFAEPRWDGSPLEGRAILLHAEQGLGDTLQFIRYVAAVKDRGGTVAVECQPPLMKMLANCRGVDSLVAAGAALPKFDVQCPLLSLPGVLKRSIDDLWSGPYLSADEQLVERWRATLEGLEGLRVGICWQGNPRHLFDAQRSFRLARFEGVARTPGVRLISLQKGPGAEQIAASRFEVVDLGPQLDEADGALMDTAAVMKHLHLVITSDTSLAHLAGALGVRVWVALSAHCDWRWFLDRDDSPWYPTMRLFRQRQLDDWNDVFERIAAELAVLAARRV